MEMIAVFGFDKTGNAAQPWAEVGVLCYCVDIKHPKGEKRIGNVIYVGADIRNWLPPKGNIVFSCFFPPCTHLAVSGSRWFKGKGLRALSESIELFAKAVELAEWCDAPGFIENPISTIATYWRKSDHSFDPCDYAGYLNNPETDAYTKKTHLWIYGNFVMPAQRPVFPILGSKMHRLPPSADRADLRNETPMGFCRAVFESNYQLINHPCTT